MPIQASPHTSQLLKLSGPADIEDDSDTEMADYGTDFSDDVDRNFDAKARPQQGSTVEIRSRRSFAGVKLRFRREADDSCMFPLSDPEYEPHAACESTGMIEHWHDTRS